MEAFTLQNCSYRLPRSRQLPIFATVADWSNRLSIGPEADSYLSPRYCSGLVQSALHWPIDLPSQTGLPTLFAVLQQPAG